MGNCTTMSGGVTIGMDLGDEYSQLCMLSESGVIVEQGRIRTDIEALKNRFRGMPRARIAVEAGTHSPWVSRVLEECGHEVLVANPRKLRLIYENDRKDDDVDAEYLARVARLDPKLLSPIQHRSTEAQQDLGVLRARDELVHARTKLINHVRGAVKSIGKRIPKIDADAFGSKVPAVLPEGLRAALGPVVVAIGSLTEQIRQHDRWIAKVGVKRYPQTDRLRQVVGVGPLTSVAYVLTLGDPRRFAQGRDVGAYLGLCPKRAQSGGSDPQLRISKAGDTFLRRLLVGSAQYILGPFGPDTDLRRFGQDLAKRGGKNAKKRAVVAVARKLSVLLHRLWISGETYEPLRNALRKKSKGSTQDLRSPPPGSLRSLGVGGGDLRAEPETLK